MQDFEGCDGTEGERGIFGLNAIKTNELEDIEKGRLQDFERPVTWRVRGFFGTAGFPNQREEEIAET